MRTHVKFAFELGEPEAYAGELESIVMDARIALESAGIPGLTTEETQQKRDGKLGAEWLPVVTALLSAPAVLLAIRAVTDVLKEKIKKIKKLSIRISTEQGEAVFNSENIGDKQIKEIIQLLQIQGRS
jgi:hypothetical protein